MRAQLAALVVHDLKNALGVLEAELGTLTQRPDVESARRSRRRCAELRRRFVEFLALYGGDAGIRAHLSDESPQETLEALLGAETPGEPGPRLRLGPCADAPAYWFYDRRLVRMALDAALHNARRVARSTILIGARLERGWLVFSITDDGPGLPPGHSEATNTGLGTELCRAVARAHGTADRPGRVVLENRPGGGALFEIWLS